jgi:Carboxypeptidase regulatory-like domain
MRKTWRRLRKEGPVHDRAVTDLSAGAARSAAVVPPIDSAQPPSGTLAVVVLDDVGQPVPFAAVRLAGTSERGRTDSSGASRIRRLRPAAYLLQVRRIGYAPQDMTIGVAPDPETLGDYMAFLRWRTVQI